MLENKRQWVVARDELLCDPKWEERGYTPAVFIRVRNKGLRAYGTWKIIRSSGGAPQTA